MNKETNSVGLTKSVVEQLETCAQIDYILIEEITKETPEWNHFRRCFLAGLNGTLTKDQQEWALSHCTQGLEFKPF